MPNYNTPKNEKNKMEIFSLHEILWWFTYTEVDAPDLEESLLFQIRDTYSFSIKGKL